MKGVSTKDFRKKWGMSQKDFANEFGISLRTVENWDYRNCCPSFFLSLCDRFLELRGLLYDEKRYKNIDDSGS